MADSISLDPKSIRALGKAIAAASTGSPHHQEFSRDDARAEAEEKKETKADYLERKADKKSAKLFKKSINASAFTMHSMFKRAKNEAGVLQAFRIKSIEDLNRARELGSMKSLEAISTLKKEYREGSKSYAQASEELEGMGVNIKILSTPMKDLAKLHHEHIKNTKQSAKLYKQALHRNAVQRESMTGLGAAMRGASDKISKGAGAIAKGLTGKLLSKLGPAGTLLGAFSVVLTKAIAVIVAAAKALKQVLDTSRTHGMKISADVYRTSLAMTMTADQVMSHMAEYRRHMVAGGRTIEEWNSAMITSSDRLFKYGVSLEDGAKFFSKTAKTFAELSGSTLANKTAFNDFNSQQFELFTRLKTSVGITEEAFSSMTKQLADSQEVRTELLKLSAKERMAKFHEMQRLSATLHVQGLSLEAATAFANKLSAMSGDDTKSRLKQSARAQAVMGAVGMGEQGRIYAQELLKGARGDQTQMAAIMEQFRERTAGMQQSHDLGTQMVGDILNEKSGFGNIMKDLGDKILQSGSLVADKLDNLKVADVESQLTGPEADSLLKVMKRLEQATFGWENKEQIAAQAALSAKLAQNSDEGLHALSSMTDVLAPKMDALIQKSDGWFQSFFGDSSLTKALNDATMTITPNADDLARSMSELNEQMKQTKMNYENHLNGQNKRHMYTMSDSHAKSNYERDMAKYMKQQEMLIQQQMTLTESTTEAISAGFGQLANSPAWRGTGG